MNYENHRTLRTEKRHTLRTEKRHTLRTEKRHTLRTEKRHSLRTVLKYNRKIVGTKAKIDTLYILFIMTTKLRFYKRHFKDIHNSIV